MFDVWFILIVGHFIVGLIMAMTLYKADGFPFDAGVDTIGEIGFSFCVIILIGYLSFIILLFAVLVFRPIGRLIEKYL